MDMKLYNWVSTRYFRKMSDVLSNMKAGQLCDDRGNVIKVNEEVSGLDKIVCFCDSDLLLDAFRDIVTRPRICQTYTSQVDSQSGLDNHLDRTDFGVPQDRTHFYSHQSGRLLTATSPAKNTRPNVSEDDCIELGLPGDFRSPDRTINNCVIGGSISAALVNTKHYHEKGHSIGAVVTSQTQYILGGKVVFIEAGRLAHERFATAYDPIERLLLLEHRIYDGDKGAPMVIREIFDYNNPSRGIQQLEGKMKPVQCHSGDPVLHGPVNSMYGAVRT
jgi:hypothetical protein